MARQTKTPGQTTEEQITVDESQTEVQDSPTTEPTEEQTPVEVSNGQLDRIEASLASLHAKLDSITEQSGLKVIEAKRWVHDPKLGHVYK